MHHFAWWANVVHTFCPVTTHSSPSRTARVFSDARSEPAPGSEKPWHQISSADRIGGKKRLRCSSVPCAITVGPPMASARTLATDGVRARTTSSLKMACSTSVAPRPPYSLGQETPAHPAWFSFRCQSRRNSNAASSPAGSRPGLLASSQLRSSSRKVSSAGERDRSMAAHPIRGGRSIGSIPVMSQPATALPVSESELPGPYDVGTYAARLKRKLLEFARVQLVGEVWGVRRSRARIYFELRDARGALPCSMWLSDFERLGITVADGLKVIVGGGCDYYPGSASSSPSFTFAVTELRVAGEGDLLIQLERLRRRLQADGLFEPQKRLARPLLPRTIGVVTGERGKARDDVLAGLKRRGWAGRLIWGFAPVQDRFAAPVIATALRDLAAMSEVDVVIVARGGGSLADLFAFCDESLCRTVALLRVPVISSVGHHTDRTLLDDVAAVCCSTPTHAAEAAVPIDCAAARADLLAAGARLRNHSGRAIADRARTLERLAAAPGRHVARERPRLHPLLAR